VIFAYDLQMHVRTNIMFVLKINIFLQLIVEMLAHEDLSWFGFRSPTSTKRVIHVRVLQRVLGSLASSYIYLPLGKGNIMIRFHSFLGR